jgi:uncharacterized protein with beta-barrel porin domain
MSCQSVVNQIYKLARQLSLQEGMNLQYGKYDAASMNSMDESMYSKKFHPTVQSFNINASYICARGTV